MKLTILFILALIGQYSSTIYAVSNSPLYERSPLPKTTEIATRGYSIGAARSSPMNVTGVKANATAKRKEEKTTQKVEKSEAGTKIEGSGAAVPIALAFFVAAMLIAIIRRAHRMRDRVTDMTTQVERMNIFHSSAMDVFFGACMKDNAIDKAKCAASFNELKSEIETNIAKASKIKEFEQELSDMEDKRRKRADRRARNSLSKY